MAKKGACLLCKSFIGFEKKIFITDAPNIHRLAVKFSFGKHLQAVNIFYQAFKIVEAGTAAQKINFLIPFKIIDDGMLV